MIFPEFWKQSWSAAIANHLWQSTLVMLVAWLLTLLLKRNQARTRYWIWMAASLKLLVPFSLLTAIGNRLRPASLVPIQSPQLTSAINLAHPFFESPQTPQPFTIAFVAPTTAAFAPHHGSPLPEILMAIWLCGVLFLLLRWSRGWWAIRTILRSASRISLPTSLYIDMPIDMPIDLPIYATPHCIEPGVVGILRPVLLLPAKIVDRLTRPQLRSVLAHESCHVRRRDNLTAAMHMLVEAIFWFHPAVWWIERRLIEERERACDEAVLQLGNEAEVYAESILSVCKFYAESPLACISGVIGSDLKQRILRIMTRQTALKLDLRRKLLLSAVAIAVIAAPIVVGLLHIPEVYAQSAPINSSRGIAATWQGILHINRDLRFVLKITTAADGTLRTTFYNIDGPPGGISAITVTLNGSLLKLELPFATYNGTLSADGSAITGTWTQGPNPQSLNFVRATQQTAWTIPEPPRGLPPMAANADPAFEVATIKPGNPEDHGPRFQFEGGRFSVTHATLLDLINFAFGLQKRQILNAPDWLSTETYDISAKPDGQGEPSIMQWQSMVKKLIANRFQFKFHYEKKELSVYLLTVTKSGSKLKRSDHDGPAGLGGGPGNLGATNATMADFAGLLSHGFLDRPVVDQTGLVGKFDLRLSWTPDEMQSATQNADALPGLFTAIQEQLGLKLASAKASADVIVIDRVERPSAN